MMREASKRPWRRPCFLSAPVTMLLLLLLAPVAQSYLSTMHLGRTLKALREQELEQYKQEQQRHLHGSLPPEEFPAPPSPDQPDTEEMREKPDQAVVQGVAEYEAAADGPAVATHPSWGSPVSDNGKGDEPIEPERLPIPATVDEPEGGLEHKEGQEEEAVAAEDVSAAPEQLSLLDGEQEHGDGSAVELSTSRVLLDGEQEHGDGSGVELSTSRVTAAAAGAAGVYIGGQASGSHPVTADDTDLATRFPEEKQDDGEDTQRLSRGPDESISEDIVPGGVVGTAATGTLEAAAGSIPADTPTREDLAAVVREKVDSSGTSLDEAKGEPTAAAAAAAEGSPGVASEERAGKVGAATEAAQPEEQVEPTKEVEEDERQKEEEEGGGNDDEEEARERGGEEVLDELKTAAIREILRLRAAQDQEVQMAAARAVLALPPTQRECFEDVKAFAFGGATEGGLSRKEVEALDTVAICGDRDGVVMAFLRHSKFDVRKAKESMRRCCAWRMENEADDLFKRAVSPTKMRKHRTHWPTGFHKQDRMGRPVFYDRVGLSDLSKLRADPDGLNQDEMVQIFTQNMEVRRRFVLTRLSREAGRPVDQMTTVLDLTGFGMKHMSKEAVAYTRRISDVFQDNYSGMTCSLLIVNAPWVFSKGWQVVETFLSEDTVAKIKVLGKGEEGLKQLEEYIAKENIPDFLGGESHAVIGPSDPLWAEVDSAVQSWAACGDPFLDPGEVERVSRRIAKKRAAPASESQSLSKSRPEAKSRPAVAVGGDAVGGDEDEHSAELAGGEGPVAVTVATAGADGLETGSDGDADDRGRKEAARSSRRAAAAVAEGRKAARRGSRRSKRQRGLPDTGAPETGAPDTRLPETVKGVGEDGGGSAGAGGGKSVDGDKEKKKRRRRRDGPVSANRSAGSGRSSSPSFRRSTSSSAPLATKDSAEGSRSRSSPAAASARVGSGRRGSSVLRDATLEEVGLSSRGTRTRRANQGLSSGDHDEEDEEMAEAEEGGVEADGKAVGAGGGGIGERILEGLSKALTPVFGAYVMKAVARLWAVGRVLLSSVENAFRMLRDLFFEQVEVEVEEA